jgi:hypothetical protein
MELEIEHKRCLDSLVWAIEKLRGHAEVSQLENIAELIIQTMSGPWRSFHTPEHIFEVGGSVDPIEVLSALFHDLVYVQVDGGFSLSIGSYLTSFVQEARLQRAIAIKEAEDIPHDLMFEIVMTVFGFLPEQVLSPFAGQNEFLSAIVAAKALEPFLSPSIIAEIVACIEATIPFRPKTQNGSTANDLLYRRLIAANSKFNFGWDDDKIVKIVHKTVRLANRDVENFATTNSAIFLGNTWNLMPETNHELTTSKNYTVADFRKSLQKMEGFMSFLKPEVVFQHFMGEPDDLTYQELIQQTHHNLEVARLYLGSKLFTLAILEALSYRLGKSIPLSTLMGELPTPGINTASLEQFLPDMAEHYYQAKNELEAEVFERLSKGRSRESSYDIKNSPTTTFIIHAIGFSGIEKMLQMAREFFAGNLESEAFLAECDPYVVKTITDCVVKLFDSRQKSLQVN